MKFPWEYSMEGYILIENSTEGYILIEKSLQSLHAKIDSEV